MRNTSMSVKTLNREYLKFIKSDISETSYDGYCWIANVVNRHLGNARAAQLTTHDLEVFLNKTLTVNKNSRGGLGYTVKSRKNIASYLRQAFTYLYKQQRIKQNPCATKLKVRGETNSNPTLPYTQNEVLLLKRIAAENSQSPLSSYIGKVTLFAIQTGLRPSELVALTLSNIQQGSDTSDINLSIDKAIAKNTIKSTKTKLSTRTIALTSSTKELLKEILRTRNIELDKAVKSSSTECFVIIDPLTSQGFINPKALYNRMKSVYAKSSFRFRGSQSCRHTFARICADNAIPYEHIASMLGHSDTKMVKQHYIDTKRIIQGESIRSQLAQIF